MQRSAECHYKYNKINMQNYLEDQDKMANLLEGRMFRVSNPEGFDYFTNETALLGP
jgi:hypothetical protein